VCARACVCKRALMEPRVACVLAGAVACDPQQRTLPTCAKSRRRCGRAEPSPDADGASPVPMQMWQERAQSRCNEVVGAQSRCRCGRGEPSRRGSCAWPDGEPAKSSSRRHRIRRPLGRSRRPGRRSTEREVHRPVGELPVPRLRRRPPSCRFRWPTMLPKWRLHFASLEAASSPLPRFSADRPGPGFGLTGRRGTNDAPSPHEQCRRFMRWSYLVGALTVTACLAQHSYFPLHPDLGFHAYGWWPLSHMPGGGDADRRRHVRWSVAHAPV
jgi:hypothetical protein